jgi:DNA-binding protein YbaB
MTAPPPAPLKLLAQDAEDLAVISAALQDAVAKVGDIDYEPKARRLTIAFNRYRWEAGGGERVRSALQLAGVLGFQARKIRRDASDAVLEILAMTFEPGEAPGGVVTIACAGGGDLRASVECVEAVLADVSQPWPTSRKPAHEL